ncbi:nitroreductase family deazaflavin-dependent oxidoreductase [Microbacterium sp. BWT-B31]|uniref:nitroreductase family deazaflavin-dependent oxidoreductase n=1 Tax=Microbacterium sp. BWT-B31 TaxID=3232072 RepID=UPI003527D0E9
MTRSRVALLVAGIVAGTLLCAVGAFVLGVRRKNPTVLRIARVIQRDFANPQALRTAGTPGSPWAVVRHTGRRSGQPYETPVGATAVDDGFFVMLPYGPGAQWVRNVRAAGAATVVVDGREHRVRPELVPIEQVELSAADRVAARLFAIRYALLLHAAPAGR